MQRDKRSLYGIWTCRDTVIEYFDLWNVRATDKGKSYTPSVVRYAILRPTKRPATFQLITKQPGSTTLTTKSCVCLNL